MKSCLLQIKDFAANPAVSYVLAGMVAMLAGVAVVAAAGIRRDQVLARAGKEIAGIQKRKAFRMGLVIAIVTGVLSALPLQADAEGARVPAGPGLGVTVAPAAFEPFLIHQTETP